jgi:hypothetical protein
VKPAVAVVVVCAVAALYACGGSPHKVTVTIPTNHRATAPAACGSQVIASGACTNTVGTPLCASSSDCTAGLDGSCDPVGGTCACGYDACLVDSDCGSGTTTACACDGFYGGAGSSGSPIRCVPANCRLDSDCGPGGYCSPSVLGGCGNPTTGFFCHTGDDECGNDSDCVAPLDVCIYSQERSHWICGTRTACSG